MNFGRKLYQLMIFFILLYVFFGVSGLNAEQLEKNVFIGSRCRIHSDILKEDRTLLISTPRGYDQSETGYPVVYLLDGDLIFPITEGIIRFLSGYDLIPGLIVVGLTNTDRTRDFTPTEYKKNKSRFPSAGGADDFLRFLREEVIPHVEKNYRTVPFRVLIGHSLGGLFVFYAQMTSPEIFQGYFSISPSLWWNDKEIIPLFKSFIAGLSELKTFFYLTIADEGQDALPVMEDLSEYMKSKGPKGFRAIFKHFGEENHASTAIASIFHGIKVMYANWSLPLSAYEKGLEGIKTHYEKLSEEFGYRIHPTEETIDFAGYEAIEEKNYDKAIELFQFNVARYPDSSSAYDSLAEVWQLAGDVEKAIEFYTKSLELNPENKKTREILKKLKNKKQEQTDTNKE